MMPRPCPVCGWRTTDQVCRRCVDRAHRRIGEIPELYVDLELTMTRQTRGGRQVGPRTGERPLPFDDRPQISAARAALADLIEWAALIGEQSNDRLILPPHSSTRPGLSAARAVRTACALMLRHLGWFRVSPHALEALEAITSVRSRLRAAVDRPPIRVYAGPCGASAEALTLACTRSPEGDEVIIPGTVTVECEGPLYAQPGDTVLECKACGARHRMTDRHGFCLAAFADDVLPLEELLHALALLTGEIITPSLVRSWRRRRRLVACVDRNRVETYRVADVMRLADTEVVRPGPQRGSA